MPIHKQLLLYLFGLLALYGCKGESRSERKPALEHTPPITVKATEEVPITHSSLFTLCWRKSLNGVEDLSFPVGSLHSRLPSSFAMALNKESLEIFSFETGEKLRTVKLPKEIISTHSSLNQVESFSNFSYSLLGNLEDGIIVVDATVSKIYHDGSWSGIATAIYGCSFDGSISWCTMVDLTHSMITTTFPSGEDILIVEDGNRTLVGLRKIGTEAFRVNLPPYDNLVIQKSSSGDIYLLVIGGSLISSYKLNIN